MNQSLQFLDEEYLEPQKEAVLFAALHNGFKITCAISVSELHQRFGHGDVLTLFRDNRWDLEEEAETAIRSQQDDQSGYFWLASK